MQTKISKGYRLTVGSWENDGDSNNIKTLEGLTRYQIEFLVAGCKLFESRNRNGVGNMYDPDEEEMKQFDNAMNTLVSEFSHMEHDKRFGDYFKEFGEAEKEYYNTEEDFRANAMHELFYDLGLTGGEFFTRVCEKITVEYIPEDILIDDVTEEFV